MLLLLVDDDTDFLVFLDRILRTSFDNVEVRTALNGQHALQMCEKEVFDFITVDCRMPVMNGVEFVKALRSSDLQNSSTPILFISGFLSEFRDEIDNFENVSFLDKPFDQTRFVRVVSLACQEISKQQKESS